MPIRGNLPALVWRDSCVLVTGGAGFIASHLVEELVARGARVTVADLLPEPPDNLQKVINQITYLPMDLYESDHLHVLQPEKFTCVFHFAGNAFVPASVEAPVEDFNQNLRNVLLLLEQLRLAHATTTRVVFVSSAAVYGTPIKLPMEETDLTRPLSPYGVSKLAAENYVNIYAHLYGLRTVSGRIFSCYGPRQRKLVVYDLLKRLFENPNNLELLGDGSQKRDFVYVKDVVRGFLHIAEYAPLDGEIYNIGLGHSYSIDELIKAICQELKCSPTIKYSGKTRMGEPDIWIASVEKLRAIGFQASTQLSEGLGETIDWFKSNLI